MAYLSNYLVQTVTGPPHQLPVPQPIIFGDDSVMIQVDFPQHDGIDGIGKAPKMLLDLLRCYLIGVVLIKFLECLV
jgi:hypothetical protein